MSLIRSINPWTGELLKEFVSPSSGELEEKLKATQGAFKAWLGIPLFQKSELMRSAAGILRTKKEDFARIISMEMGKVIRESRAEIEKCAWLCDFYAEKSPEFLTPEQINLPEGKRAKVIYRPLGVILAVMPWNFPFWQVFRFAVPTLMAGNVGILKHASNVPQCALAIQQVFEEAGFPKGVFQSLLIDSDTCLKLLEDSRIKAVSLTGSEKAGATVASVAGLQIKKSLLELGGSDPFIVLKDADIVLAAETAAKARMINFGQSCIAAKRFIVEEEVYQEFLDIFSKKIAAYKKGDPLEESSDYSCMARPDLAKELFAQVQKSVDLGARTILGGNPHRENSAEFAPTILTDIPDDSPAYSEELFGPVASVFRVNSEQEAIELANSTEFGLGASLWTADLDRGEELAAKVESGSVFINDMVASHPYLPFGGLKKSGYGRELGRQGILEFVNHQSIYLG
jgi:succinate-semialdehyde dehydrogenase / glutarate-semialdehyde dehydrogenase